MTILGAFSGYSSDDIEACKTFYRDTLGMDIKETMGGISLAIGDQQVFIYPKPDHEPAGFTVLNLVVDSIDDAVDELVQKGVVFERYEELLAEQDGRGVLRGKDAGEGPNIAWFKDPSANILALVEE